MSRITGPDGRFEPQCPEYAARVAASFARQSFMATIGAELGRVEPGFCEIRLPWRADLCQQHGFIHAGVTTTLADNACGYAAYSLMPEDSSVLTVEFKTNFMAPGAGEMLIARGMVEKPGRSLTVTRAEVVGVVDGREKTVALMQATMMSMAGRPDSAAPAG
ncbi:Phenylacetic acid degradation protein PaaD, thioesterase [Caenispirillum salinarum AK4]|uniref:Medium/long-chain acyl-CoA thioesterase YigI n=1 Tax=Caenispirillum salinarum AK4 TaxID=1238182 RepID=K9GQ52_9PROT|nr:PaaI family thioesterase [Caenispirillum salinarum]EKV26854.1 Phenylacetic acid degradation protein PaaD, thioesterase [Caenispirillum salinarum AK4]